MTEITTEAACAILKTMGPMLALKLSRLCNLSDGEPNLAMTSLSLREKECLRELGIISTLSSRDLKRAHRISVDIEVLSVLASISAELTYRTAMQHFDVFSILLEMYPDTVRE